MTESVVSLLRNMRDELEAQGARIKEVRIGRSMFDQLIREIDFRPYDGKRRCYMFDGMKLVIYD